MSQNKPYPPLRAEVQLALILVLAQQVLESVSVLPLLSPLLISSLFLLLFLLLLKIPVST